MKKTSNHSRLKIAVVLSLPLQYLIVQFFKNNPEWVEAYFSHGIYPVVANFFQLFLGWIPFSVGDLLYAVLIFILLQKLWFIIRRKNRLRYTFQIYALISFVYFLFHFFWGLNYYRIPLHKQLDIKQGYSTAELLTFTEFLIDKTNEIHINLTSNDSIAVGFKDNLNEVDSLIYRSLSTEGFLHQNLKAKSLKPSLISLPLSYMGFGGYINPLTLEAQYNYLVPNYKYPTLLTHEMAHQLGYAKENEANFVACFVTMNHENRKIRYAGFTYALKFCLNDIYRRSPDDFERLMSKVNPGILKNYKEVQVFWENYNNPLEPLFKEFYGGFLKANNQPQGIESYNYVVALLVNYYSEKALP